MTADAWATLLASRLPSERMKAAEALTFLADLSPDHRAQLAEAVAKERVPRIRTLMELALRDARTGPSVENPPKASSSGVSDELAGMILHELNPGLGSLRRNAQRDIPKFAGSGTSKAIDSMQRRVAGLAALIGARKEPVFQPCDLHEALEQAWPDEFPRDRLEITSGKVPPVIRADVSLLGLILGNALRNSCDELQKLQDPAARISATVEVGEQDFSLTVRNPYLGKSFSYRDVAASGRTTKHGQRGLGTRVMQLSAEAMDFTVTVMGSGGLATFSLRGNRNA